MFPWQPLRIEVVVGYTFDLLSEAIFYLLQTFLTATIQRVKFMQRLMLIHITIVKKYTVISITCGYYLLPWQSLRYIDSV